MTGYNRFEQSIGSLLNRFPRVKQAIETGYQRASYHLFADSSVSVRLHEDVSIETVSDFYGYSNNPHSRFVGFYDICPWDQSMDTFLTHEIPHGTSRNTTTVPHEIAITAYTQGRRTEVGTTAAWNHQQGSRTQWHPTRSDVAVFNDIQNGTPIARTCHISGETTATYDQPIQAVSPTRTEYASIPYVRLDQNSPGYGYGTIGEDPLDKATNSGLWLNTFEENDTPFLCVSLEELIENTDTSVPQTAHYLHHVVFNPTGDRLAFLHRWRNGDQRHTRLITATRNGEWWELINHDALSHFCWLDTDRLFLSGGSPTFGRGYHIVNVAERSVEYVDGLDGYGDGHPSLSPDGEWIVTDTYPDRVRNRSLILYHLPSGEVTTVGEFFAPFEFKGTQRCDLHPRWSPDGRYISIDSAHEGYRESYILDVRDVIGSSDA